MLHRRKSAVRPLRGARLGAAPRMSDGKGLDPDLQRLGTRGCARQDDSVPELSGSRVKNILISLALCSRMMTLSPGASATNLSI